MRIKDISPENRPRERFFREGASVLSDAELLALILQKGTKEENVVDVSNRLIAKYGVDKLSSLSLVELMSVKGIGMAKAMQIKNQPVRRRGGTGRDSQLILFFIAAYPFFQFIIFSHKKLYRRL